MSVRQENWAHSGVEPKLDDVIADPIVHMVMRRDNVTSADLLRMIARARSHLCRPAVPQRR
jgi:hypothetical protein